MKPLRLILRAFGPFAGEQILDFAELRDRSFFLIHGATGAGKTSILDAMCFALYGESTSNARQGRQLRSDHADPSSATEVFFDFRLGADVYRIHRIPEYERPKKRGEGTMRQPPRATLWRMGGAGSEGVKGEGVGRQGVEGDGAASSDGNGDGTTPSILIPMASGWAAVNEAVARLMGFAADQFRQVVILPQGQFQKLLIAKSDERQTILEALFQVHTYARIEQALKESAGGLKDRIESVRRGQAEVLVAAGSQTLEELSNTRDVAEVELAQTRDEAGPLRTARQAAQEQLAAARRDADKLAERDIAARDLAKNEARREEFTRKESARSEACKAAALMEIEADVKRRRREADDREKRAAEAEKTLERAAAAKISAERKLADEEAGEPKRVAAGQRVTELEALGSRVLELDKAQAATRAARGSLDQAIKQQGVARLALDRARQAVARLSEELKQLDAAYAQTRSLTLAVEQATVALASRRRLEEVRAEFKTADGQQKLGSRKLAKAREQLEAAKRVHASLHAAWVRGQAAVLARDLIAGAACPVCGSTHHPNPAVADHDIPHQDVLDEQRVLAEKLQATVSELQDEQAVNEGAVATLRASAAMMEMSLGERASVAIEVMQFDHQQLTLKLQQAEAAGIESAQKNQQLAQAKQQEEAGTQQLAAADAAVAAATADLKSAEAVAAERAAGVPEALRSTEVLAREKLAATTHLKQMTDALDHARKSANEAAVTHAASVTAAATAKAEAQASREVETTRRAEFIARVKEAGFGDYDTYKAAKLESAQIDALDAEVRDFRVSLETARERLARATAAAEGLQQPDLQAISGATQSAEQAVEQNVRQEQALDSRLKLLNTSLGRLRALDADLAALEAQYQLTGHIAEVANGRNDYRMTFQRYVLGVFLDEVLYAASLRLRIMSRSRYTLQRLKDPATGRSAGGLDLEVHDEWTGTTRAASTLSGGECFLASLSLALGLADVVQGHAGGIRLETIFVDEGFGTLDPESLDLAIRALQDLQQGGRLVGIISHVTELKEWIDARLELTTGKRGSAARFVVS